MPIYDWADLWAMQIGRGCMSNGPIENEPWWQEWKHVRQYIELKYFNCRDDTKTGNTTASGMDITNQTAGGN